MQASLVVSLPEIKRSQCKSLLKIKLLLFQHNKTSLKENQSKVLIPAVGHMTLDRVAEMDLINRRAKKHTKQNKKHEDYVLAGL